MDVPARRCYARTTETATSVRPRRMNLEDDRLGTCMACDTPILESQLVLTYEDGDTVTVLAECPSCREITYPG